LICLNQRRGWRAQKEGGLHRFGEEYAMKSLVIYDTSYGNTSRVAFAIAKGLGDDAAAIEVEKLGPEHLTGLTLLVVGSPTQGGRPTASMQEWLKSLPDQTVRAAAFDTRLRGGWVQRSALDFVGYAAPRIAKALRKKGCNIIDEPQGFIVTAGEGPLAAGELERASTWGATLKAQVSASADPEAVAYDTSGPSR
jgi:flavodoxin I